VAPAVEGLVSAQAIRHGVDLTSEFGELRDELLSLNSERRYPRTAVLQATHLLLCIRADRQTNEVNETVAQLAASLSENERTMRRALDFLDQAGIWQVARRGNQHAGGTVRVPTFIPAADHQRSHALNGAPDHQRDAAPAVAADTQRSGAQPSAPDQTASAPDRQRSLAPDHQRSASSGTRTTTEREHTQLAAAMVRIKADEVTGAIAALEARHGAPAVGSAIRQLKDTGATYDYASELKTAVAHQVATAPAPRSHPTGPGAQPPSTPPPEEGTWEPDPVKRAALTAERRRQRDDRSNTTQESGSGEAATEREHDARAAELVER
jgi:hypothetical protein